nr:MAG TPA: hypothetical protein [Caudoviricetes sp.]
MKINKRNASLSWRFFISSRIFLHKIEIYFA